MILYRNTVAALVAASSATTAFKTEPSRNAATVGHLHHSIGRMRSVACAAASSPSDAGKSFDIPSVVDIPSFVVSPVLALVYPALIAHNAKYGNPNIPLGSTDGKRCKTLRRLHFQKKLSDEEEARLIELGFIFHSFEDVYYECDFDEMLGKVTDYRDEFQTYQIPKKYDPDPELGAWVTMLRRLDRTNDLPQVQIDKLDAIGFEWKSSRKCGSSFMGKYKELLSDLRKVVEAGGDVGELMHENTDKVKWINAQRLAHEHGNLSDGRIDYMNELPGIDWKKTSSWT